jgi:hypothetical protein
VVKLPVACPSRFEITALGTPRRCISVPQVCLASCNRMIGKPAALERSRNWSERPDGMTTTGHDCEPLAGRRSTALIHLDGRLCTAYPAPPFLPVFHPPIELASWRPRGRLHLDRWIDFRRSAAACWCHVIAAEIHYLISTRLRFWHNGAHRETTCCHVRQPPGVAQ